MHAVTYVVYVVIWHPPLLLNTFVQKEVTGQHESLQAHSPDVMITAKTEKAFGGKGTCEKHFVLSSVVKSCKKRRFSRQSQRPFIGPECHPFNGVSQMAAHNARFYHSVLGSAEASLHFY